MDLRDGQVCDYHLYFEKACSLCTGKRLWKATGERSNIACSPGASLYFSFGLWLPYRRRVRARRGEGLVLTKRIAIQDQFMIPRRWSGVAMHFTRSVVRLQVMLERGELRLHVALLDDNRHPSDQRTLTIHLVGKGGSSDSLGNSYTYFVKSEIYNYRECYYRRNNREAETGALHASLQEWRGYRHTILSW